MTADDKVSDLGEWGLLNAIRSRLPGAPSGQIWSGDDAAVVSGGEPIVFTTDAVVAGIDFDLSYGSARSVGIKALAVNASDVAAMGGQPRAAVATLVLPGDTPAEVAVELAEGLATAGEHMDVDIVGGDISEGTDLALTVAMIGTLPGRAVTRTGARPGDLVCVTGALGGAAAGLALLRAGSTRELSDAAGRLLARQLEPTPRIAEGVLLAELGATAMIDVSDGLIADLVHLLDASGVGCDIDASAVPVDPDILAAGSSPEEDATRFALAGGEDFELLFTLSPGDLAEVRAALDAVTPIGTITESERTLDGRSLESWDLSGWEHLRPR